MISSTGRPAQPPAQRQDRLEARREDRRRRLLAATLAAVADRGYNDTSVDQIVARARTSKTTFYEFFASKEDCVRDLLEREGGSLIHSVAASAAQGADHRDRMRRGIRAFVELCHEQPALARLLLVESVGISQRIEHVRQGLQGRFAAVVAEEIRRAGADADPFYAAVDPVVFGWAVIGAVNEATAHFLDQPGGDPASLADSLCRIFAP